MTKQCKARQYSDQMLCECGLAWDVNDPDPPECRKPPNAREVALEQIAAILEE